MTIWQGSPSPENKPGQSQICHVEGHIYGSLAANCDEMQPSSNWSWTYKKKEKKIWTCFGDWLWQISDLFIAGTLMTVTIF